jgi:hypothetical protein
MANRLILVTGTRNELSEEGQILVGAHIQDDINSHICTAMPDYMIFHGGCPTGVDQWVNDCFYPCWTFPADWQKLGKSAGPTRNQAMVETAKRFQQYGHSVICYAFPGPKSTGTIDCLSRAERAGIETVEIQLTLDHLS